jgi:hypothetical protein
MSGPISLVKRVFFPFNKIHIYLTVATLLLKPETGSENIRKPCQESQCS